MNIETNRLLIRKVLPTDAASILDAVKCPEVHTMHSNQFTSIEAIHNYIQLLTTEYNAGKFRTIAIAEKTTNTLTGTITLDKHKHFSRAEIGYWINSSYRNMGYATEAITAIYKFAFNKMSINRIQAIVSDNPASERILVKSGMVYEGTLREYIGFGDVHRDCKMYAILKKDLCEYIFERNVGD